MHFLIFLLIQLVNCSPVENGEHHKNVFTTEGYIVSTHPMDHSDWQPPKAPEVEQSQDYWDEIGQNILNEKLNQKLNTNVAKNVIVFIGDGMGIPTLMASRVYMDDLNFQFSFEKFPYVGLSKIYCIDYQVPDSSCTASAILSGVKSNCDTLNVNGRVASENCTAEQDHKNHIDNIFKYAQDADKATGVITNMRVTHATPAAAYAKSAFRDWEGSKMAPEGCQDIADQLINGKIGQRLDVAMGGGSRNFLPTFLTDKRGNRGERTDGRNLIDEYLHVRSKGNKRPVVVQDKFELDRINANTTDSILGLFASSHMSFRSEAQNTDEPSLIEMVAKTLEVLKKNPNGYVLLVEGGLIDRSHHESLARKALDETVGLHEVVEYVKSVVSEEDTLLVVTADHSHTFTVGGYPPRETDILGYKDFSREDNLYFFTLNYANGMGYYDHNYPTGGRKNPDGMDFTNKNFRHPATLPMDEQTHGGEDVGVFAVGPHAHLLTGTYEQSYIGHAMMYASCLGPKHFMKPANCPLRSSSSEKKITKYGQFYFAIFVVFHIW